MTKPTGKPTGVRYKAMQTEACREKIRTSAILGRLQRHINGKLDMSPTQVRAAEILLSKVLPSLQSAEIKADVRQYVARLPEPAQDAATWLASVDKPLLVSSTLAQGPESLDTQGLRTDDLSEGDDKTEPE
jgi:hypothetical protein